MSDHLKIVPAGPEHRNFVIKSFVMDYSKVHSITKNIAAAKICALLDSSDWKVSIATVDGAGDEILGWLLWRDRGTLGYTYVKHQYRRHGVAKALLEHADVWMGSVDCAFFTPHAAKLAREKGYILRFRPYLPDTELEGWLRMAKLIESAVALENETNGQAKADPKEIQRQSDQVWQEVDHRA